MKWSGLTSAATEIEKAASHTDRFWTAVAKYSDDTAFACTDGFQSGVALRFPPQSKKRPRVHAV
jgi:hypothetical protein